VSAHMLHDIVRKLPDGSQVSLVLEGEEQRIALSAGSSKFYLPVLSADEFPDMTAGEMAHRFTLPSQDLKRLIEKSRFAISTEETRYYLNGIFLHEAETNGTPMLRAVATDGHRLAQVEVPLPEGAASMPGIIVPRKTVLELHRLVENDEAAVEIALSAQKIQFTTGPIVMTSKLIDGTFPDYGRVIPHGNDKLMQVSKQAFATAVDRVSTVSTDRGRAVKLSLDAGKLNLSVFNPDGGSAQEELEIDYEADALDIGFNARYLLDIAQQLESDTARFHLADPGSPTTVRDAADESALYVLMPMRV
ncbi:MAG: DNA polymerase III subunit beta, partial [Pseudomonadota bacterium]